MSRFDLKILMDQKQKIKLLALVFMKTLGLDGEHGLCIQLHALLCFQPAGKFLFVFFLDLRNFFQYFFIFCKCKKLFQAGSVFFEFRSDQRFDLFCKGRVAFQKPAAERDAVCLVIEFFRIKLIKISQLAVFQNFRMESRHAVGGVSEMDIHVSHMDHVVFINDSYGFVVCSGARKSVQLFDHRHKLGNHLLQEASGPFFQSLRKDRVIGIGAGIRNDLYSFFKLNAVKFQKTDQLRDHHAGMSVVDLDSGVIRKIMVIAASVRTFFQDKLCSCADHEILLINTQKTSVIVRIVRIQKQCQVLCNVLFVKGDAVSDNGFIYRIQIEKIQAVCPSLVAGDRESVKAGGILFSRKRYREKDIRRLCRALGSQPVIGRFILHAVFEILMEKSAVIAEPHAVSRKV